MADIRRELDDVPLRLIREQRDATFDPLINDPEKVKALSNGPILNPLEIIRYRINPGRKPRMARAGTTQIEMFPS